MNDCLFCKIIEGEIPSFKLNENSDFVAILDAFPKENGHTLIIPKVHSKNIFEFDSSKANNLLEFINETKDILTAKINPDGFYIRSNINESAGQVIFHTHLHLVPSFKEKQELLKPEEFYKKEF